MDIDVKDLEREENSDETRLVIFLFAWLVFLCLRVSTCTSDAE